MLKYFNFSNLISIVLKKDNIWLFGTWLMLVIFAYQYTGHQLDNDIHRLISETYTDVIKCFSHVSDKTFNYNKNTLTDQDRSDYDVTINKIHSEMKNFGDKFISVYIVDAFNNILAHNNPLLNLRKIKENPNLAEINYQQYISNIERNTLKNVSIYQTKENSKRVLYFCYTIKMMDEPVAKCYILLSAKPIDNYIYSRTKLMRIYFFVIAISLGVIFCLIFYFVKKPELSNIINIDINSKTGKESENGIKSETSKGIIIDSEINKASQSKISDKAPQNEKDKVGSYFIRDLIGEGGMSEVFIGVHENKRVKAKVAIKKMRPELTDLKFIEHFFREVEILSLLNHKNIVKIIDFKEDPLALIMEYVNGKNLSQLNKVSNGGLNINQFLYIATEICEGLWYSHSRCDDDGNACEIVHRDINPNNIIVSYEGNVKITDFGISKATHLESWTRFGVAKGTYDYMSPEQILGNEAKQPSDIFSLGIVLYEMLSGKRLNTFERDYDAFTKIPKQIIPPIKKIRKGLHNKINDIVMKCLEKEINNRYQNVEKIIDDLNSTKIQLKINYTSSDLSKFMNETFLKVQE